MTAGVTAEDIAQAEADARRDPYGALLALSEELAAVAPKSAALMRIAIEVSRANEARLEERVRALHRAMVSCMDYLPEEGPCDAHRLVSEALALAADDAKAGDPLVITPDDQLASESKADAEAALRETEALSQRLDGIADRRFPHRFAENVGRVLNPQADNANVALQDMRNAIADVRHGRVKAEHMHREGVRYYSCDGGPGCPDKLPTDNRASRRLAYVRDTAKALAAAMTSNPAESGGWDARRAKAIEQAGLIFDETEPSDG